MPHDKQRIAQLLREHPDLSAREIAALAGVTGKPSTVRRLVSRIRSELSALQLHLTHRSDLAAARDLAISAGGFDGDYSKLARSLTRTEPAAPTETPAPAPKASREYFDTSWFRGYVRTTEDEGWKLAHSYSRPKTYTRRFTVERLPVHSEPEQEAACIRYTNRFADCFSVYDVMERFNIQRPAARDRITKMLRAGQAVPVGTGDKGKVFYRLAGQVPDASA